MESMARGKANSARTSRGASIETVAHTAGVSIATVSRVINNSGVVSPTTAERVRRAIDELGFRPNRFAQGLMTRKSGVLGISLPDLHGEFYSALIRAADSAARARGYHLLVGAGPHAGDRAGEEFFMPVGLLDGVALMITEPNERLLSRARLFDIPVVLVDVDAPDRMVDSVRVDNGPGAREATRHLLASVPPARCYFVGGPSSNYDTAERARAFEETLSQRGILLRDGQCSFGEYSLEWGYTWAHRMLSAGALDGAGVLAANDEIAWGIMQAAQEAGLEIPERLKLMGFDNTRLSTLVRPRLSTVNMPLAELGSSAIDLLVRRIEQPASAPQNLLLGTSIIVRETSVNGRRAPR